MKRLHLVKAWDSSFNPGGNTVTNRPPQVLINVISRKLRMMMEEQVVQPTERTEWDTEPKDVVLSLTVTGARDCIMKLLEHMDAIKGFSVLDGSFVVSSNQSTPH